MTEAKTHENAKQKKSDIANDTNSTLKSQFIANDQFDNTIALTEIASVISSMQTSSRNRFKYFPLLSAQFFQNVL